MPDKLEILRDMPHLRKRMQIIDSKRLDRIRDAKDNRNFRKMVKLWAEDKLKPRVLSDRQRLAIHYLTDFVHNHSYSWIATKLNIPEATLTRWRNEPLFLRELDKEITRRRSFIRIHAFRNVHRAIMRGSMKDTWNYLKMSGDLKENIEITDRTGETELSDTEIQEQIVKLSKELANEPAPSAN